MTLSIRTQKALLPKIGQIARYGSNYVTANLRYRITSHMVYGNLVIPWGYKVKWDEGWVSFGKEKALLPYRLYDFKAEDKYYFRDMRKALVHEVELSLEV